MKKCIDCNVDMIEEVSLHTDYVGGTSMEERVYLTYEDEVYGVKPLLSINDKKYSTRRLNARVCPKCGKVDLYVNLKENESI